MISKTYYRYIWLLNILLPGKPLTYEEIVDLWKNDPNGGDSYPLRTFHEHRKGIKEMFGVDVVCEKTWPYRYSLMNAGVLDDNKPAKWLLSTSNVPKDFITYSSMKDRIMLEEVRSNPDYLKSIIKALQKNVELEIDYQKHEGNRETFQVQPYLLKMYHRRWYLLGYVKEREEIRHLALDRMLDVNVTRKHFTMPEDFDAKKYYANTIGVYVDHKLPIKEVKIRAYGTQMEYLRSLPLHQSQKEGRSKYGEYAEFTYRVRITPELITQLLAMGDKVEVLGPESLREEMKEKINNMLNFYK